MLIEVEFGTKDYGKVLFEINDYDTRMTVGSTLEEMEKAYDLLHKTMNDETFIDDHCRNDDAVNCCIALHVLGYDPVKWFDNFFDDQSIHDMFFGCDINKFMDHVHRICGYGAEYDTNYPLRWGPAGDEGAALGYVLD